MKLFASIGQEIEKVVQMHKEQLRITVNTLVSDLQILQLLCIRKH